MVTTYVSPPLITIFGFTVISVTVSAVAPTESVAVIVSQYVIKVDVSPKPAAAVITPVVELIEI